VNDGSPSGFALSSSEKYCPFKGETDFYLPVLWSKKVITYGTIPNFVQNFFSDNGYLSIPFHPDDTLPNYLTEQVVSSKYKVSPTASPRTMVAEFGQSCYLKLNYNGVLGRINRQLPYRKAIAEVEVSKLIIEEVLKNDLNMGILSCPFCNNYSDDLVNFSFIYRDWQPFPQLEFKSIIIPCFSLFSTDRQNKKDPLILNQIIRLKEMDSCQFLEQYIFNVLKMYISLAKDYGLLPELNAQNLLYEFDEEFNVIRPIIRDFMEVEKDLTIRRNKGLNIQLDSIKYKVLEKENLDYFIRHSFSFDFKLTQYVIEPIVKLYCESCNHDFFLMIKEIREFVLSEWGEDIKSHFYPYDKWFSVPKILLANKNDRKYIINENPLLR